MEQEVFGDSASPPLELVRGSNSCPDETPKVWIKGDCWPPYGEIVTRYPLSSGTKLNVFVDCVEGQSELTFGLISPNERSQTLGMQNGERIRITGTLWAWNSKHRRIFNRPFDSRTSYGSSSPIVQLYDEDIKSGSVLGVYRDLKTNHINFVINGKKGVVSFSSGLSGFCYGYVRLSSRGSSSEIQVTLLPEIMDEGYFNPSPPVMEPNLMIEPVNTNPCCAIRVGQAISNVLSRVLPDVKAKKDYQEPEITQLSHYRINACHPRGICLLINNLPHMAAKVEKQLKDLFKGLFFDVKVQRRLQTLQIYKVAQEFAKKDHSDFDSFVFIILSLCQDNDISGVDGRKASLEHVMTEYTSTNCPTLRGKPKLFFVQRFTILNPPKVSDGSIQSQCFTDVAIEMQPVSPSDSIDGTNCPEEADFLLACVTSAVDKSKPTQEVTAFIQVLIKVIKRCNHRYHLLEMLTKINKWIADEQRGNPNGGITVQVPYLTHTLRAKVHLGSTPVPVQVTGSLIPDVGQRNCYKLDRRLRGLCVIINNVKFSDKAMNRTGAEEDERNLKQLFKDLFFRVIVERDLNKHQMENVAAKYGAKDHSTFDSFVMIVMSHGGNRDCILGVNGRETSVKNLMMEFQAPKCPSLNEKPKVFIIQTCRGPLVKVRKRSTFPFGNAILQAGPSTSIQADNEPRVVSLSSESTLPRSVIPREFDFVLAFATVPGYVSYRSEEHGAFFVQTLVEVIREHHHSHHFLEILTEVTKRVVERQNHKDYAVQVPAPMHTMTKLLYL